MLLVCLSFHSSSVRRSINYKVMWALIQWHVFLLYCPRVVWEQDGVQWATEWKMWRIAQRDSVGEEPGETVESEGKAGIVSRWNGRVEEGLALCSGKGVVGTLTYGNPPLLLLPALGTASMTTKPFPGFSVTTKPEPRAFCSSCSGVTHGSTSGTHHQQFPLGVFSSHFTAWPQRWCARETHTSITSVTDLDRIYCSLCGLQQVYSPDEL